MCGTGDKACAICINGNGCLCSMSEDCFAPATKEQLLNRLERNYYPRYRRQMWEALALTMEDEQSEERNKTMSKYIIEIEDTPFTTPFTDMALYKAKNFKSLVFDEEGLKKLERYEEPSFDSDMSDAYEDGLKDAWIAARRIFCTPMLRPGLLINELFDKKDAISILLDYEAGEVIDRLNKFDQERPQLEAVKELADKIGIHKLYSIVKELRGEE